MSVPVVCIIGRSDSGKTTLMERLIPELKRRGYHVGTVKHHSHAGFDIDKPGKDSWRHAQAGSDHVVISAPDKIASYRLVEKELSLDEIVSEIEDVDIILVEGYKQARKPSIEIIRGELGIEPIGTKEQLFAIATNVTISASVPVFDLNNAKAITDVIEEKFLKPGY